MEKLYETHSMLKEQRAIVTACIKDEAGIKIILDKSIFFPEGGGQHADKGVLEVYEPLLGDENAKCIKTIKVLDGQEIKTEEGRRIVYAVDDEIEPGMEVLCKLDWDLRFSRMQQHSGEHVLTGIVHNTFGYDNVSFRLSDDEPVTVCFSGPLTEEQIEKVELLANRIIYENHPIVDTYPTKEALAGMNYRSKIEIEGQVRIITIGDGIDVCACCAPHVPSTAYIGIIKVISTQSYKGGTQLNILCGSRAFEYIRCEHKMVMGLSHDFSTSIESLPEIFASQKEKLNTAEYELAKIRESAYLETIAKMTEDAVPVFFAKDMTAHAMKSCYNALCEKYTGKFCGVFSGDDDEGYRFYAGNPALDSNELAKLLREGLNAKGGGSRELIQGKIDKKQEEITAFFKF